MASDIPGVAALCHALTTTGDLVATLLRSAPDPGAPAVGAWTVGETAAHVAGSADSFLAAVRDDDVSERLDEVDAANAAALAADPERDPRVLADRLVAGEHALVAHARQAGGDPVVRPFAGVDVPLSTVLGIELGELLVHGYDIASATGRPWPIDPAAARLTLQAYLPLFPYTLDAARAQGVDLAVDIRIRGMRPVVVSIADERLTLRDSPAGSVDAHLAATPVAYLLLMWNRVPVWRPVVHGDLLVWGRRPWRAAQLNTLLVT